METYLLILTLLVSGGRAGIGGVTTVEVEGSKKVCEAIGQQWVKNVEDNLYSNKYRRFVFNETNYTCIKLDKELEE